jgi:hypothetical protein
MFDLVIRRQKGGRTAETQAELADRRRRRSRRDSGDQTSRNVGFRPRRQQICTMYSPLGWPFGRGRASAGPDQPLSSLRPLGYHGQDGRQRDRGSPGGGTDLLAERTGVGRVEHAGCAGADRRLTRSAGASLRGGVMLARLSQVLGALRDAVASLLRRRRTEEVPAVAGDVEEHGDAAVGFGARRGDELDSGGRHPLVGGSEVVYLEEEPDPAGELVADDGGLILPSARARRMPVSAPGGRTTTHRLGRPSLVSDGESSTSSNSSSTLLGRV